jgi:hypothetical protein
MTGGMATPAVMWSWASKTTKEPLQGSLDMKKKRG